MKKETPSQYLSFVLEGEYHSHKEQWEALKGARRDQFEALHETQQKAILDALSAWDELRLSYSELCAPNFEDICKADNALLNLKFHFNAGDE